MLLDPKLDVVFKILFTRPENEHLLRSMLNAVLAPAVPISSLKVLNPEIPKEIAVHKGIVLDIRVDLEDGTRLDVEMESLLRAGFVSRLLFYWARVYCGGLKRGEEYGTLTPVISVVWLNDELTTDRQMHSIFKIQEVTTHTPLTNHLAIHVLELTKVLSCIDAAPDSLRRWARFLTSKDKKEFEQLAKEDPVMEQAKQALEKISGQADWCDLAEVRRRALDTYWIEMSAAKREGKAEGKAEGMAEGEAKGRAEGKVEGKIEGKLEGKVEMQQEVARKMKKSDFPLKTIEQITGLSKNEIEKL